MSQNLAFLPYREPEAALGNCGFMPASGIAIDFSQSI